VALKLDSKPAPAERGLPRQPQPLTAVLAGMLLLLLLVLTGTNLWTTIVLSRQVATGGRADRESAPRTETSHAGPSSPEPVGAAGRERFARALYDVLVERGGRREWSENQPQLLAQYDRLVKDHKDLRLDDGDTEGKVAVGAIDVLSQRSADRVEEMVRKALSDKGFHPDLVKKACEFVHEQLVAAGKEGQ
jgi:hypothetical protein